MKTIGKILVYLAAIAIIAGIVVKIGGINFSDMGISVNYPIKPQSFLNFANSILLFSIALFLMDKGDN